MAKDFSKMENSNDSSNIDIHSVSAPGRRILFKGTLAAGMSGLLAPWVAGCATIGASTGRLGFTGIPAVSTDTLMVPNGYTAEPFAAWGEPIGVAGTMPAFKEDASNTAAEQAVQMGMHHDGIHYFPLNGSQRGLLVMNHEYTDDGLLHPNGMNPWTLEKVRKAQAAHGIAVIEVEQKNDRWQMVQPSPYARRVTATTPCGIAGPAAGHELMKTAADVTGRTALGTLNNCASGMTPWGTYLSGEENFANYFSIGDSLDAHQKRWGLKKVGRFRWAEHDERFDAAKHPNEFNRFGWVVELDPMDPTSTPIKRTALGRAAHEGAWVAVTRDGRAVVYSGEDARFEYIYKFVSRDRIAPGGAKANRELLDHGTLYVARFDADSKGRWIPLVHGTGGLIAANGFHDQGEVMIKARQASDRLGATKMDRPEWIAIDQNSREVFCTLTNNSARGKDNNPGIDPANPRANNTMGQIIRWKEKNDFDSMAFTWDHLVFAGDPSNARAEAKGNIKGDIFSSPDGVTLDKRGILWIQTDASATQMYKGELKSMGNNQMLACDPATGEIRRFLTGPINCEVTGVALTPDGTTMFVNIQHPGESPGDINDPANPSKFSKWPYGGRPRSATVVIRKHDGGLIGT